MANVAASNSILFRGWEKNIQIIMITVKSYPITFALITQCMKKILLVIAFIPLLAISQSKKKKLKVEQQANETLVNRLRANVQYLADDKLEGRRTGTNGELLSMQYVIDQYKQIGIEPKGEDGYVQEFTIEEGKQVDVDKTFFIVNDKRLELYKDFFPLAFSASAAAKGSVAVSLKEKDAPWFIDLAEVLEDNSINPHFDVDDYIKKAAASAAHKRATALIVYNSSAITDNVLFNKNDPSATSVIPVIYTTKEAFKKFFPDVAATLQIELHTSLFLKSRKARNVIGFINNNVENTIILGAHYDHLGFGEDKNALDTLRAVHNGADDNASGTAALIELARLLKQSPPKNNNYLFINFSGEELGLMGSKYWLEHPTLAVHPNYMINMDMVGRYDTIHKLTVGGYGTSPLWGELFKTIINPNHLLFKFDSTGSGPSDHEAFYRKNIPVLFFFTGTHSDYHKASDDWQKINYEGERMIVQFVYKLIAESNNKGKLVFTKTTEPQLGLSARFTVSLGVMPDYAFNGTGVKIDGISRGKIAEKIGLQPGDVLLQLGMFKFVDVMSYMQTLGRFKKGDKTKLKIKRGKEEKEFDIEF
jgi:aminopeptidase YwaD